MQIKTQEPPHHPAGFGTDFKQDIPPQQRRKSHRALFLRRRHSGRLTIVCKSGGIYKTFTYHCNENIYKTSFFLYQVVNNNNRACRNHQ